MRPHVVVVMPEAVHRPLLVRHRLLRRRRGLLLERQMHALVSPVLLRLARLDAFRRDSELNPPHTQPREPTDGLAREGRAVVGPDPKGKTEFAKRPVEVRP